MKRQQRWLTLTAGLVLAFLVRGPAAADEKVGARPAVAGAARPEDEKAIRATGAAFVKAFNAGDAKAIAAMFTLDADYVDHDGQVFRGREAIEKEYARAFLRQKGMTLESTPEALRFLGADVAIQDGVARVRPAGGGRGNVTRFTIVLVRRDSKWLAESVRESPYTPDCNYEYLCDLEWLVGSWSAQASGAAVEVTCNWVANRNFLLRTFSVKSGAGVLSSGTQVIGWDPVLGQVRSWTFDSDGGFGSETWTREEKRWVLDARGMRRDGGATKATNYLTLGGHDQYTWQSVARKLDNAGLPDSTEIKFVRAKAKP